LAYAGHESSERTPVTSTLPGDQRPWTQISHVCVPERMNARVAAATPNGGYRVTIAASDHHAARLLF
jgi:hypothetical protein